MKRVLALALALLSLVAMTACRKNDHQMESGSKLAGSSAKKADPLAGYTELYGFETLLNGNSDVFHGTVEYHIPQMSINGSYYVPFHFFNMGKATVDVGKLFSNVKLHCIIDGEHHQFRCKNYSYNLEPLAEMRFCTPFDGGDAPGTVWKRGDTIAYTFTFVPTNTDYIIYIRESAE